MIESRCGWATRAEKQAHPVLPAALHYRHATREVAMKAKKPHSRTEDALADHVADSDLRALVEGGCSRAELLGLLELAFLTDESWKKLLGVDLRKIKATMKQINKCADEIDQLNRSELIHRLSIEHRDPRFVRIHESPTLPDQLRKYASLIESLPQVFGPKHKVTMNAWKAWIVATISEDTGKNHDREVSSLIAAVLDDSSYSEKAHQAWRLKHGPVVEMMRQKLRKRRARIAARTGLPPRIPASNF
jgi:hypothetical protein